MVGVLPRIVIDVDSTVKTVCGNQQGASVGYNPHRHGAASYHPILAFCAETKEILQGWLRSGSVYTSNAVVEFMRQLLAHLPNLQLYLGPALATWAKQLTPNCFEIFSLC